jgi:hypothetical protein
VPEFLKKFTDGANAGFTRGGGGGSGFGSRNADVRLNLIIF